MTRANVYAVITSYSIHYTKLYDGAADQEQSGLAIEDLKQLFPGFLLADDHAKGRDS